jgi:hypothetical protein
MRTRALTTPLTFLVPLALLWPARAGAELPRAYGATTGTSIEAAFGGNGITDDDYVESYPWINADLDPLVGLSVAGYYRFIDWVSVGLVVHYAFLGTDFDNVDHSASGFLGILAEVRGHLPVSRIDPWVGFGIGYAMTFSSAEGDVDIPFIGSVDYDGRLMLHGVGIGLSAGMNIFVTERLALGPYFRLIFGAYPTACYQADVENDHTDECDDVEGLYEDTLNASEPHDMPHLWVVGIDVNYTFE